MIESTYVPDASVDGGVHVYDAPMAEARWASNDMPANIDSGKSDVLATTETLARELVGPFMRVMVTG